MYIYIYTCMYIIMYIYIYTHISYGPSRKHIVFLPLGVRSSDSIEPSSDSRSTGSERCTAWIHPAICWVWPAMSAQNTKKKTKK